MHFHRYFANKAVGWYLLSLFAVSIVFMDHALRPYLFAFGVLSVAVFFYGSASLTKTWQYLPVKQFEQKVFWTAFIIRVLYVIFIYNLNYHLYGTFYESEMGDILFYVPTAQQGADFLHGKGLIQLFGLWRDWGIERDDTGYMLYLSALYYLVGNSGDFCTVIVPLLMKALFGAFTCLFVYRIGTRHFGEKIGRMAGVFCMLEFNMIWWCGSMMKETEMVFVTVASLEVADKILFSRRMNVWQILLALLLVSYIFFFRTVLGLIVIIAFFMALLLSSQRLLGKGKKVVGIVSLVLLFGTAVGSSVVENAKGMVGMAQGDYQETNMEWRAQREGGNSLAGYASKAVFAPLIFTIPFPTMTYTNQSQEKLMQVSGGYYVKNILSFFVILALITLLLSGEWKKHIFPLFFLLGYLASLALSAFAQSGRYHLPAIPIFLLFAAYGYSLMDKRKVKWFDWVLLTEFVICIAWNWFKLAGRGMV